MKKKKRMPRITKNLLSVIVPIILIAVIVLSATTYWNSRSIVLEQLDDTLELQIAHSINQIDKIMVKERALAESVASFVENSYESSDVEDFEDLLIRTTEQYPETVGMGVWFAPNTYNDMEKFAPYAMMENGEAVASREYTENDFDIHTSEWYIVGTQDDGGWTEAYIDTVSGLPMVTISVPMYEDDSTLLGSVTVDVDISSINQIVSEIDFEYEAETFAVENSGVYLANENEDQVMEGNINDGVNQELANEVMNFLPGGTMRPEVASYREAGSMDLEYNDADGSLRRLYIDYIPETNWVLGIDFEVNEINSSLNGLILTFVVISIIAILFVSIFIYIYTKKFGNTAANSSALAEDISTGKLNTTVITDADLKTKNELGDITNSLVKMQSNLRGIVSQIASSTDNVVTIANDLAVTSEKSSISSNEVGTVVENIAEGAASQAEDTQEASFNVEKVRAIVDENIHIMDELIHSTENMDRVKDEGYEKLNELIGLIKENTEQIMQINKTIEETNERSQEIEAASEMIQSIADQTNLLALNAAIEAARAGEAGQGFSVVANEIKNLAEQSSGFTGEIATVIRELKSSSSDSVEIMEKTKASLLKQGELVDTTKDKFEDIANAIKGNKNTVEKLQLSSSDIKMKNEELVEILQSLSAIAEENSATTEEVAANAQEQVSSSQAVSKASEDLSIIIKELQAQVENFKL